MEDALGHPGEDVDHGVDAVVLRGLGEIHHPPAVGEEFTVEELVHDVQLCDDVDQTQTFTGPVADGVKVVSLQEKKNDMCLGFVTQVGCSRKNAHVLQLVCM